MDFISTTRHYIMWKCFDIGTYMPVSFHGPANTNGPTLMHMTSGMCGSTWLKVYHQYTSLVLDFRTRMIELEFETTAQYSQRGLEFVQKRSTGGSYNIKLSAIGQEAFRHRHEQYVHN